jgi:antitoxin (DNA-binding transcriptional repressor) of toxin-antitoxin stability system
LKIMRTIGAFEAKNKLGRLLDLVEAGQEIVITRRGKAAAAIRAMSRGVTLGGLDPKDLVAEGRL